MQWIKVWYMLIKDIFVIFSENVFYKISLYKAIFYKGQNIYVPRETYE